MLRSVATQDPSLPSAVSKAAAPAPAKRAGGGGAVKRAAVGEGAAPTTTTAAAAEPPRKRQRRGGHLGREAQAAVPVSRDGTMQQYLYRLALDAEAYWKGEEVGSGGGGGSGAEGEGVPCPYQEGFVVNQETGKISLRESRGAVCENMGHLLCDVLKRAQAMKSCVSAEYRRLAGAHPTTGVVNGGVFLRDVSFTVWGNAAAVFSFLKKGQDGARSVVWRRTARNETFYPDPSVWGEGDLLYEVTLQGGATCHILRAASVNTRLVSERDAELEKRRVGASFITELADQYASDDDECGDVTDVVVAAETDTGAQSRATDAATLSSFRLTQPTAPWEKVIPRLMPFAKQEHSVGRFSYASLPIFFNIKFTCSCKEVHTSFPLSSVHTGSAKLPGTTRCTLPVPQRPSSRTSPRSRRHMMRYVLAIRVACPPIFSFLPPPDTLPQNRSCSDEQIRHQRQRQRLRLKPAATRS